jgi:hypothetical protein
VKNPYIELLWEITEFFYHSQLLGIITTYLLRRSASPQPSVAMYRYEKEKWCGSIIFLSLGRWQVKLADFTQTLKWFHRNFKTTFRPYQAVTWQ